MATHHFIRAKDIGFQSFTETIRSQLKKTDAVSTALKNTMIDRVHVGDIVTILMNNGQLVKERFGGVNNRMTYLHYPQGTFTCLTRTTPLPDTFPIEHWDGLQIDKIEWHPTYVGSPPGLLLNIPTHNLTVDENYTGNITVNGRVWVVEFPNHCNTRVWYINELLAENKLHIRRIPGDDMRLCITE